MIGKWTKRDLKLLRDQLEHFVTFHSLYRTTAEITLLIEGNRLTIIIGGLRSLRETYAERAERNREAVVHFERNPGIYGNSTPEMIERFSGFADDDAKAVWKIDRVLGRLESEGLPSEVSDFTPDRLGS